MRQVKGEDYLPRDVLLASLDFGLQAEVRGDFTEMFGDGRIDITFVPGRPSAEYFYVFPFSEEHGYVGYVSPFENRKTCKDQLLKSLHHYQVRVIENIEPKLKGKFIPGTGTMSKPYAQGFLAVGDEAGQVEPIFRGGIRLGCEAGEIAGHTLSRALEKEDLSRDSLSSYGEELKKIAAIDYVDDLVEVKNSIIPKICSYQPVRNDELMRVLQAFKIIENSGW
jgi:flavin-dependent dehydrogenase